MKCELTIIPIDYELHMVGDQSCCVWCDDHLRTIQCFVNPEEGAEGYKTTYELAAELYYQSIFSICPSCESLHLELLSGATTFKSPVTIEWEKK